MGKSGWAKAVSCYVLLSGKNRGRVLFFVVFFLCAGTMGHRNSHELELLPIEAVCTVMGYTHAVSQGCKTLSLILEDTGVCVCKTEKDRDL